MYVAMHPVIFMSCIRMLSVLLCPYSLFSLFRKDFVLRYRSLFTVHMFPLLFTCPADHSTMVPSMVLRVEAR